ncbi:MAG: DUF3820 family protein [Syntrophobacteraceae bacterium]
MRPRQHDGTMTMPFGKYRGQTLEEIPSGYLRWIALNVEDQDELQEAADSEFQWREEHGKHVW